MRDEARELPQTVNNSNAEAVGMRNRGFQAGGEGSLFGISDQADSVESAIYRSNAMHAKEADIILDFFAGSGTTAHAALDLNAEDNGNRQFILVQIDEPISENKSKVAYDFCVNELHSKNPVISDITIERVKKQVKS